MRKFVSNLGIILVLIGVLVIAIPAFQRATSNLTLVLGLALEIVGFILHIVLGRRVRSEME